MLSSVSTAVRICQKLLEVTGACGGGDVGAIVPSLTPGMVTVTKDAKSLCRDD